MLTYDTLLPEALRLFPEFKKVYNKLMTEDEIDAETGNHIVFSYAFVPVLIKAIQTGNKKVSVPMFEFIDRMAACEDNAVGEVCDFTILEELNDAISDDILVPYFGEETMKDFQLIKRYMR